ncbi:hypothetical protein Y032_0032g2477 [Ancylostoma ceylanicum]|uniref:Uncharacterized protein n=1 Tax=Ancylostoma ceylanicum TaxID=53326 RepID=A0A016UPA1_9BILA|nr:hypothetical protein Y032_0032g2477 [Ancylostoma ceylanicum]
MTNAFRLGVAEFKKVEPFKEDKEFDVLSQHPTSDFRSYAVLLLISGPDEVSIHNVLGFSAVIVFAQ